MLLHEHDHFASLCCKINTDHMRVYSDMSLALLLILVVVDLDQSDIDSDRHDNGGPAAKRLRSDEEDVFTETITIDWNDDNLKVVIFKIVDCANSITSWTYWCDSSLRNFWSDTEP